MNAWQEIIQICNHAATILSFFMVVGSFIDTEHHSWKIRLLAIVIFVLNLKEYIRTDYFKNVMNVFGALSWKLKCLVISVPCIVELMFISSSLPVPLVRTFIGIGIISLATGIHCFARYLFNIARKADAVRKADVALKNLEEECPKLKALIRKVEPRTDEERSYLQNIGTVAIASQLGASWKPWYRTWTLMVLHPMIYWNTRNHS